MPTKNEEYSHKPVDKIDVFSELKTFAEGVVKGNTTDVLGAPGDVLGMFLNALSKNSVSKQDNAGGSASIRKFFNLDPEDKNLTETAGTMASVGGLGKAMIVPFIKLSKQMGRTAEQQKTAEEMIKRMTKEGIVSQDKIYNLLAGYGDVNKVRDVIVKGFIDDATAKIDEEALNKLTHQGYKDSQKEAKENPSKFFDIISKMKKEGFKSTTLEQILDHPELYEIMPELRKIKVSEISPYSNVKGQATHYPGTNRLPEIDLNLYEHGYDPEAVRRTLLHEVQHAVQGISNFDMGGTPNNFRRIKIEQGIKQAGQGDVSPEDRKKLNDVYRNLQEVYNRQYRNISGEQEARFTEATMNLQNSDAQQFLIDILKKGRTPTTWATR